jgi:hypothetical protein
VIAAGELESIVRDIFAAAGCDDEEAARIAKRRSATGIRGASWCSPPRRARSSAEDIALGATALATAVIHLDTALD